MRKLLISTIITLLLILCVYTVMNGIKIGDTQILGVKAIQEKNEQLDVEINDASKLASVDYPKTLSELDTAYKELEKEKEDYENLVTISSDEDIQTASQYEKYEIEFLWTTIGNHATEEGVTLKLDIKASSSGTQGLYDLSFTTNGTYVGITDFITDIENDSKLGFRIDNFKMIPSGARQTDSENSTEQSNSGDSASNLQATFTCKDIDINLDSTKVQTSTGSSTSSSVEDTQNNNETTEDETTENTNAEDTTN